MLLGTVLGLRACDVANLKLSDIDWVAGEVKILQSKTLKTVVLPLTNDVGGALKDYILNARPKTDSSHIFIRLKAPFTPIKTAVAVGEIFYRCCKSAGLDYGKRFHMLRRSLATSMINTGSPVTDVAQVLGDANINSTKKYLSFDSERLKLCALPLDGIKPKGGGLK
jgi:integrase